MPEEEEEPDSDEEKEEWPSPVEVIDDLYDEYFIFAFLFCLFMSCKKHKTYTHKFKMLSSIQCSQYHLP